LMALNSMCASACSKTARPSGDCMLRRFSLRGSTSSGRAGRPGRSAGSASSRSAGEARLPSSAAAYNARAAAALLAGSISRNAASAERRAQFARFESLSGFDIGAAGETDGRAEFMATRLAKETAGTATGKAGGAALATAERWTACGFAKRPNHTTVYNTRFDHLACLVRGAGRTKRPSERFRAFCSLFCSAALMSSFEPYLAVPFGSPTAAPARPRSA
jgi:hypothetical protein